MDAGTILILGAVLLGCGSLSLFLVSSTHAHLKGMTWVALAFAAGSCEAVLNLRIHLSDIMPAVVTDALVLLPFVAVQVAASELLGKQLTPRFGLVLLGCMAVMDVLFMKNHVSNGWRLGVICLLVSLQTTETGLQMWRLRQERRSTLFCSTLLFAFAGYNVLRGILAASGLSRRWHMGGALTIMTFSLYIGVALGLAFGLFWMSNASLATHLEEVAGTDPLTRVFNRRAFLCACENELRVSAQKGRPCSILMADLDHFKSINDRFGHAAGDHALVAVVESMQNAIRGVDTLGRWGGEEFVALLPNASAEAARIVAERIRSNIERLRLPIATLETSGGGSVLAMTISIGLSTYQASDDLAAMLRRADQCLYMAKDAGRNCVLQIA